MSNTGSSFKHRTWWYWVAPILMLSGCATCAPDRLAIAHSESHHSEILKAVRDDLYYPQESCLAKRGGTVLIRLDLLRNGEVENIRIHKSSGDELLDREAVRALTALGKRGKRITWPPELETEKDRVTGEVAFVFQP